MPADSQPRVSIVMPAYNAARFIAEAIESVIAQTLPDWELIVVDDASTDDTAACVQACARRDARIHCVRNERNLGAAQTRNRAIDLARGRYIAFLDSDDVWLPHKLATQVAFMEKTGTPITYGDYLRIDEAGIRLGRVSAPPVLQYRDMLKSNFIGNLTGVYRRDRLSDLRCETGGHEDYLFWLRALRRLDARIFATPSDTPLACYRVAAESLSGNKLKAMAWQWTVYRRRLGLPIWSSLYYLGFYIFHALRKRARVRSPRFSFNR